MNNNTRITFLIFTKSKILILFFYITILFACSTKTPTNQNPYITTLPNVSIQINLNLPEYANITFTGGTFLFENQGINGILVSNLNDVFYAWEATCSNHNVEKCSKLKISNTSGTCSCSDEYKYSFLTGQLLNPKEGPENSFPLLSYKTIYDSNLNTLRIHN